jgi:hypothetical protein
MRHSDLKLTMQVYTKLGREELHAGVAKLPAPGTVTPAQTPAEIAPGQAQLGKTGQG